MRPRGEGFRAAMKMQSTSGRDVNIAEKGVKKMSLEGKLDLLRTCVCIM